MVEKSCRFNEIRGVEGHSASRLCAAVCSFGSDGQGCEKVDQSPHGRDGHAPPFLLQSPISKGQWYHFLGMPTTRIAKRFDGRSDLSFVKFIPSSNLATDTSGPVLISNGSGNIEAIAQAKDVGDLVNS